MSDFVLAPFSHGDIRDWPVPHFARLVRLLVERFPDDHVVHLIGGASQWQRACDIVRDFPPARVRNTCGRLPWPRVLDMIRDAACVVGNNSGIAHLGARMGTPTVCVFGGSHQRLEWRPVGFNVITLSRTIGCSPCHIDHRASCRYDKSCLRQIEPEEVADAVAAAMAQTKGLDTVLRQQMRTRVHGA